MRRTAALLLLLAACAPRTVPPASTPPPPPPRPNNAVAVHGSVFDSAGQPVPHAMLRLWGSDPSCSATGEPVTSWSGASSRFEVTLERGVGPAERGCVIVEATAGGATARRTLPVTFTNPGERVEADLTLPPPARLTRAEADRIIDVVRRGITTRDRAALDELAGYLGAGPEAVSHRLSDVQRHLRTVTNVTFIEPYVYELQGHREPPLRVTVTQDSLTRVAF